MKDDLVEQVAAAIRERRHNNTHWSNQDIAEAILSIARPAILEEAAKTADANYVNVEWDDGDGGEYGHGYEDSAEEIAAAIRALAHTTGQEGGR